MQKKAYFNWSTGKDSSFALYKVLQENKFDINLLLTSINTHHNRVSMHGLSRKMMMIQISELAIPSQTIELPEQPTMTEYNCIMTNKIKELKKQGYNDCFFGDIFLEDLKEYRKKQLLPYKINSHFPLWKRDTSELLKEFIELGFKAVIISINNDKLDKSFLGRTIDHKFISDLPKNVDPCGENGEFHTFCYAGPIFNNEIKFSLGDEIFKQYKNPKVSTLESQKHINFGFIDLLPELNNAKF